MSVNHSKETDKKVLEFIFDKDVSCKDPTEQKKDFYFNNYM